MIFYIAQQKRIIKFQSPEFTENTFIRLVKYVSQHIQSSAVSHANYIFHATHISALFYHGIHGRDKRFATAQRKTFLSREFIMNEFLKHHRSREFSDYANVFQS